MKRTTLKSILIFALFGTAQVFAQEGGMPAALVEVSTAQIQSLAPVTLVPGTVSSRNDARLAAELDGRLEMVAEVGDVVEQGQPVARIESTRLQLRQQELEAEAERARARLGFLEKEEARFNTLAKSNLAAATQLEQTRSERDVARGDLRIAESRMAQNQDQLNRTVIRAPFAGTVVERLMRPGERANDGGNIVRLVDQGDLEIVTRAPLEYYGLVEPGMSLRVRAPQGDSEAEVRAVVAVGDENTHQFELRLNMEPGLFPVGQTVRVAIPTAITQSVLAVPRDALVLRPGGITVYVVDADDRARQVPVTTGVGSGEFIEIRGDVQDGDRVVVRGNERLQPGQPVSIAKG